MHVLILYPHWPPSNLVGAQRVRLIANGLNRIGYKVTVVTVSHEYYEEDLSWELCELVDSGINVVTCSALPITRIRLVGDIALRGFVSLYRTAKNIIKKNEVNVLWISVPSYYTALIGRLLHYKTDVRYTIDYIDPWVRINDQRKGWRFRISNYFARWLEPIAINKASLITGVSNRYFLPVLHRNFDYSDRDGSFSKNKLRLEHFDFPYGFDQNDYQFNREEVNTSIGKNDWYFAGALMPKSRIVFIAFLKAVATLVRRNDWPSNSKIRFDGTGYYEGQSIEEISKELGIDHIVNERRDRIPYSLVLSNLKKVNTVLLFGSTEIHYTPSKVFQQILSGTTILGALHPESATWLVLKECNCHNFIVRIEGSDLESSFIEVIERRHLEDKWDPNIERLEPYRIENLAHKIDKFLNKVVDE